MRKVLNIILVIAMIALMMMSVCAKEYTDIDHEEIKYEYGNVEYCNCGIAHIDKPFEWWTDITDRDSPQWDLIHNYLTV